MLALKIGDNYVELPSNFSIAMEINNHGMLDEVDLGDFSFPFTLDATQQNMRTFGLSTTIQLHAPVLRYDDVWMFLNNNQWKRCAVIIDRITNSKLSGYIKIDFFGFATLNKKLSEIDFGGEEIMGTDADEVVTFCNSRNNDTAPNQRYCFPAVYNPNFYPTDKNPDFLGILNRYDISTDSLRKNNTTNTDTLVPMPYIKYILNQIAVDAGILLGGDFWDDAAQDYAWLYSNRSLDDMRGEDNTAFVGINAHIQWASAAEQIIKFQDETTAPFSDPDGRYTSVTGKYTCAVDGIHTAGTALKIQTVNYSASTEQKVKVMIIKNGTIMAFTEVKVENGSMINLLTVHWSGSCLTGDEIWIAAQAKALTHPGPQPYIGGNVHTGNFSVFPTLSTIFNDYALTINLANHMPDWTVLDFFRELKRTMFLSYSIDLVTQKLLLNYSKDRIAATPNIFTTKALPGFEMQPNDSRIKTFGYEFAGDDEWTSDNFKSIAGNPYIGEFDTFDDLPAASVPLRKTAFVTQENRFYWIVSGPEWEFYSDNYYPRTIRSDGTVDLRTKLTPIFMTHIDDAQMDGTDGNIVIPTVKGKGQGVLFELGFTPAEPRIGYFKKITRGAASSYPFSSSLNLDPAGASIDGIDLGMDNMYTTYWEKWLNIICSDVYFKYIDSDILAIYAFDPDTPAFLDNLLFTIRKATIQLRSGNPEPIKLEMFRHE